MNLSMKNTIIMSVKIKTDANSNYNKLAVQWLNEHLCFVSSSMLAESFRLRNHQLLVAANRVCLESNVLATH